MKKRNPMDAHIPTWIKATLTRIACGDKQAGTYRLLGSRIAASIEDFVEDIESRFTQEEWKVLATFDGFTQRYRLSETINPTRTLKKMFASERHPKADFVLLIPSRRRADFLEGILDGLSEDFTWFRRLTGTQAAKKAG